MGNYENKAVDGSQEFYCLKQTEVRIMSEIWKSVETDLPYYGSQFYSILFHNHPQYFKYFQEKKPHEFQVDFPTMRTKFSLTCSTLAALFVEYSHKSQAREHLLGYVAMVHKDMNLTKKDMKNFMMDMMELLMKQFPKLMTADCCLAYMRYTASLTSRLHILMKKQREVARRNKGFGQKPQKDLTVGCFRSPYCDWLPSRNQELIYGRPAEYWDKKSRYWIVQRAVWATMNGKKRADSARREIILRNNVMNLPELSISEDSTSSCPIHEESYSDRAIQNQTIMRKRQFRKPNSSFIDSNDDVSDVDVDIASKSNNCRLREASYERRSRVSIINSTARERRRRNLREEFSAEEYPRAVTIQNEIGTGKKPDDSFYSIEETGERDIPASSLKLLNVANGMKDRGTSISNVSNKNTLRTSSMAKKDPDSTIIGSGTSTGRNVKTNKQVSISNAPWISPRELNK